MANSHFIDWDSQKNYNAKRIMNLISADLFFITKISPSPLAYVQKTNRTKSEEVVETLEMNKSEKMKIERHGHRHKQEL